jgi:predicted nucleic acid-binding protein
MQIVINSSPLIFLAKLGYLRPFLDYPDSFYIPASQVLQALISSDVLQVRTVALINLAQSLNQRLGQGESDAISLGIELNADYVLLDDLAARKEAIRLGLNIRGTLGVTNKMRRDGKIIVDSLDSLYARFTEVDFRVKRSIFDQIFLDE